MLARYGPALGDDVKLLHILERFMSPIETKQHDCLLQRYILEGHDRQPDTVPDILQDAELVRENGEGDRSTCRSMGRVKICT